MISEAEDLGADPEDWITEALADLPRTEHDNDWERLRDVLFADRDFDMLDNHALDGKTTPNYSETWAWT